MVPRQFNAQAAGAVGTEPDFDARASHTSVMFDVPFLDEAHAGEPGDDVRDGGFRQPRLGGELGPRASSVIAKIPQHQAEVGGAHLCVPDWSLMARVRDSKTVMFVHDALQRTTSPQRPWGRTPET